MQSIRILIITLFYKWLYLLNVRVFIPLWLERSEKILRKVSFFKLLFDKILTYKLHKSSKFKGSWTGLRLSFHSRSSQILKVDFLAYLTSRSVWEIEQLYISLLSFVHIFLGLFALCTFVLTDFFCLVLFMTYSHCAIILSCTNWLSLYY